MREGQEPGRAPGGCGFESRLGYAVWLRALSLLPPPTPHTHVDDGARSSYSSGSLPALPEITPEHRPTQPRHTVGAFLSRPTEVCSQQGGHPRPTCIPGPRTTPRPLPAAAGNHQSGQAPSQDLSVPGARAPSPSPGASACRCPESPGMLGGDSGAGKFWGKKKKEKEKK